MIEAWAAAASGAGEAWCRFGYDAAGLLLEAENENGVTQLAYDTLGRIEREVQGEHVVERVYDHAGLLSALRGPGGEVRYRYDAAGRMVETILPGGKQIQFVRDPAGRPVERHLPGDVISRCSHSATGRLSSQEVRAHDRVIAGRRFEYDPRGQLVRVTDVRRGASRFGYDPSGRLMNTTTGSAAIDFAYDPAGNPTQIGLMPAQVAPGNRLVALGDARFSYDVRGRCVRRANPAGTEGFHYNAWNQLIAVDRAAGTRVWFRYDAFGRRIEKRSEAAGGCARYVWDQLRLLSDLQPRAKVHHVYHPEHFLLLASEEAGQWYYHHTDQIGTILECTDEAGRIAWAGSYHPLGRCQVEPQPSRPSFDNRLHQPGHYHDPETGLHYNVFRYYDPESGRFLTPDPAGYLGGDYNLYRHVRNDPINLTDPIGLDPFTDAGLAIYGLYLLGAAAIAYMGSLTIQHAMHNSGGDYGSGSSEGDSTPSQPEPQYDTPNIPDDPAQAPGEGWEWRGKGPPGSGQGNWVNPETGEWLHPDMDHPEPIGPHWDWQDPGGERWRIFPDGTVTPK